MDYFNLTPSELNNIILSYLPFDDLVLLLKTFNWINLNWSVIHQYHFGEYNQIELNKYLTRLASESLIIKFKLRYTIDELLNLEMLSLYRVNVKRVPQEIEYLTNLIFLNLSFER